jgi:hypothetical protein
MGVEFDGEKPLIINLLQRRLQGLPIECALARNQVIMLAARDVFDKA